MIDGQRFDHAPVGIEIAAGQRFLERRVHQLEAARAQVVRGRNRLDRDLVLGELLDVAQQAALARFREGDGDALAAGATRPSDAVQIRIRR